MKLSLPDVTLCAVTGVNYELTIRAMKTCMAQVEFADAVMITAQPVDAPFKVVVAPDFSGRDYAPFICRNLTRYTTTSHNLVVQYDGYITDPTAWSDRFLAYDYIGAAWPWHPEGRRVGNSGFCLRSKRLLDLMAEMPLPPTGEFVDDVFVCHTMRGALEKNFGIKFAPEEIADRFSYERKIPDRPSFGFHGMFNFWRHVDDSEMENLHAALDDMYVQSRAFAEVLFAYHDMRKFPVFRNWYKRLRTQYTLERVGDHLAQYLKNPAFIEGLVKCGEELNAAHDLSATGISLDKKTAVA